MFYVLQGDTAGAFSRITGSLGQAVATLTFDSNFQMVGTSCSDVILYSSQCAQLHPASLLTGHLKLKKT